MKSALSSKEITTKVLWYLESTLRSELQHMNPHHSPSPAKGESTPAKGPQAVPSRCKIDHCGFAQPITPQAMRAPESPDGCVFRSSGFAWTTTERPITDFASLVSEIW